MERFSFLKRLLLIKNTADLKKAVRSTPYQKIIEEGMLPKQVADYVFNAIKENKFYIFTHPEFKKGMQVRMEDILQERNPTLP